MRPSVANLGKGNPPHFWGLRSEVMNFFNRNCIVVDSIVNYCHYEGDTTIIRMALCREIQGLHFYAWFVGLLTGALLHFLNITQNACIFNGQERVAVQPTDQFDHVSV